MSIPFKPLLLVIYSGYFLLLAPLSTWLLFQAQTAVGLLLATFGLLSVLLLILLVLPQRKQNKFLRRTPEFVAFLLVVLGTAVFLNMPSGILDSNSPVHHRYYHSGQYGRFALSNIIPETEQINLGFTVMPYVDPLLTVEQSRRVSAFTMDIYREMEQDSNFHELGSAMNLAYADLWGRPLDVGHYYLYVPHNRPTVPLPAIVFLHGSAGNFKAYTWIWSKLAEAEGFVIIAPSYGFGNWDETGAAIVLQAIEDAKRLVNIDENRLYLAGLSNGGLGVSQLAQMAPEMFQGLIFLSPVMDTHIVDSTQFQAAWANRPVLVISGEIDKRIPISYVEQRIANLERGHVNVTTAIYPNEDHFLVFSQPDSVMQTIAEWLSRVK